MPPKSRPRTSAEIDALRRRIADLTRSLDEAERGRRELEAALTAGRAATEDASARLHQALEIRMARLATMARLTHLVSSSLEAGAVLREIVTAAARLTGSPFTALWTADDATRTLTRAAVSAEDLIDDRAPGTRAFGEGIVGWVALHRRARELSDVSADERVVAREWLRARGFTAGLYLPILHGDALLGVLALLGPMPFRLENEDRDLLDAFVAHAAAALSNARLYEEATRQAKRMQALADVERLLSETLDSAAVAQRIVDSVRALLDVLASTVYRLDEGSGDLLALAVAGDVGPSFGPAIVFPSGMGVAGLAVRERRPIATPDLLEDRRVSLTPEVRARIEQAPYRAVLAIPLVAGGRVIGALGIGDRRGRVFTEENVRLAQAFADQAALALENARLFEEAERQRREAEVVADLARTINASLDLDTVLRRVVEGARELCASDGARIAVRDPETGVVRLRHAVGAHATGREGTSINPGQGLGGQVLLTDRPARTGSYADDPAVAKDYLPIARDAGAVAVMVVPVSAEGRIEGLLYVFNQSSRVFTDRDEAVLRRLADHAAIAIRNAQLFTRELAARHALRRAHDEYQQLVESVQAIVWRADAQTFQFTFVSREAEAILGYPLPRWTSEPAFWSEHLHPEDRAGTIARCAAATAEKRAHELEYRMVAADGRVVWLRDLVRVVVQDDRPKELVGVMVDVTARRRAEEVAGALAEVGRELAASLDFAHVTERILFSVLQLFHVRRAVLYRFNPDSGRWVRAGVEGEAGGAEWIGTELGPGEGVLGAALAAGEPRWTSDLVTDHRFTLPDWLRARVTRHGLGGVAATPLVRGGAMLGGLILVDATGREFTDDDLRLLAAFADQAAVALDNARLYHETDTQRRRAETLAAVGRRLSETLDLDEVGYRIADTLREALGTPWGELLQLDSASGEATVLGLSHRGLSLGSGFHLPARASLAVLAIRERRAVQTLDLLADPRVEIPAALRAAMTAATYRATLVTPVELRGEVVGALSVADREGRVFTAEEIALAEAVAERAAIALENATLYRNARRAYEDLSRTQQQLVESQKMEAIGRLAGGIAHDFNNLLTVIIGRVEILLARADPQAPIRRPLELIGNTARRAAELTRQLLAFSRRQILQPRVFDLAEVITSMGGMLRRLIGEDVELVVLARSPRGHVHADPGQLSQVVLNLAVNARDAMPRGGRLTIETTNAELDEAFCHNHPGVTPGPHVMLAVSDTGSGMDAGVAARIFEPFFTTKEVGRGTGLGLSVVYGIVQQSGGTIAVESEPGRGATFRIYLPRVADAHRPEPEPPTAAPRGTETILLVEDEEEVRSLAREILERQGYAVLDARDAAEALRIAEHCADFIHLVLTDAVMPAMSGRELAERLLALRPGIRVLYMSGYTDDAMIRHGVSSAGPAFLQKPFTVEALAEIVRRVLDAN